MTIYDYLKPALVHDEVGSESCVNGGREVSSAPVHDEVGSRVDGGRAVGGGVDIVSGSGSGPGEILC
jgi:hypothetical protein